MSGPIGDHAAMTRQDTARDTAMTRPGDRQDTPPGDVFTVAEVAARLGVTPDAVRRRLHRGTLVGTKTAAGEWRILLPDTTPPGPRPDPVTGDRQDTATTRQDAPPGETETLRGHVADLRGEVAYLRDQLAQRSRELATERERSDVIQQLALQRIPVLVPGDDSPQAAPTAAPERQHATIRPATGQAPGAWWRRLLGLTPSAKEPSRD